jgi:hypothetical protein
VVFSERRLASHRAWIAHMQTVAWGGGVAIGADKLSAKASTSYSINYLSSLAYFRKLINVSSGLGLSYISP